MKIELPDLSESIPDTKEAAEIDFLKTQKKRMRRLAAAVPLAAILFLTANVLYAKSQETKYSFQEFASGAVRGNTFSFGRYEQDADPDNGAEEIVWIVLTNRDGKLTAISRYGLESLPFHEESGTITWEDSSIRNRLNTDFYEAAFDKDEKSLIALSVISNSANPYYNTDSGGSTEDYVYLLSEKEAEGLSSDISIGYPTASGKAGGISTDRDGRCEWWLRTAGITPDTACRVSQYGDADAIGTKAVSDFLAVRPCITIEYQ